MATLISSIYIVSLIIAPQLWFQPILNLRTDYFIFPIWIACSFITGNINNFRLDAQVKFFFWFFIWLLISMIVNQIPLTSHNILLNYTIISFVFILFFISFNTIDQVRWFIVCLLFFVLILSIEGIDHYTGYSGLGWANQPLGWAAFGSKGRTQWIGIFDGPGVFCVLYTIALPFFLLLIQKKKNKILKLVGLFSTILLAIAIFLNGSRGGFLTALSIIGMVFGLDYYNKNKLKCAIGVCGAIVLFLVAPSQLTSFSDGHKSTSNRIDMWAEGMEMVSQNPVFGIGRGRFQSYTGKLIAHNSAIEIMGETGVVGLFLWMGMIYFSVLKDFD